MTEIPIEHSKKGQRNTGTCVGGFIFSLGLLIFLIGFSIFATPRHTPYPAQMFPAILIGIVLVIVGLIAVVVARKQADNEIVTVKHWEE